MEYQEIPKELERIEQLKILNIELQGMWEKLCTKVKK